MTTTADPPTPDSPSSRVPVAGQPLPEVPAAVVLEEDDSKVLDLTTMAPTRRVVKLPTADQPQGEQFEIRLLDDFGIQQQQKILTWSRRYDSLYNREPDEPDLTEDQADMLKFYLDSMFEMVLDAPKAVKRDMRDGLRQRVVQTFSYAPLVARQEEEAKAQRKSVFGLLVRKGIVSQERLDQLIEEADKLSTSSTSES